MENAEKILECIVKCNAYFHLNMEDDKDMKRRFYKVKDAVVGSILNGEIEGLSGVLIRNEVDGNTHIALVEISCGAVKAIVHCPYKVVPVGKRKGGMIWHHYIKDRSLYIGRAAANEVEFNEMFGVLQETCREIYNGNVMKMTHGQLINALNCSAKPAGYVVQGNRHSHNLHMYTRCGMVHVDWMTDSMAREALVKEGKITHRVFFRHGQNS